MVEDKLAPHEGRIQYFKEEIEKQIKRKKSYLAQLGIIRKLLETNEKEINYNEGWIDFHENAIQGHKKEIESTFDLDKKIDQEKKLKFHETQIQDHHKKYIEYHNKEKESIKKEIEIFGQGIKRCEVQLEFLENKQKEHLD